MDQKGNKIKSAFGLFVKLYIARKNLTKHKGNMLLMEATKSWVTLSDEEKEMFVKKFNECKVKRRNKFAENLKQMQPYMKKKILNRIHQNDSGPRTSVSVPDDDKTCVLEETPQQICIDQYNKSNELCTTNAGTETTEIDNVSQYHSTDVTDNGRINVSSNDNEYPTPILTEPTPPQIRNAKELFELIKARVGASNVSWSSLPNIDKKHYQKAVYLLKKDYIRNYKIYLESLSPKELFEYYHTFIYTV